MYCVGGRMEKCAHGPVREAPPRYNKTLLHIHIQKHMQTCMHTANDALVDMKIFGMGGMWKSRGDLCTCTKRLSLKVFDPLSGWFLPFTQWLLLSPNLAAIKEVQLLLFSQSNLRTG